MSFTSWPYAQKRRAQSCAPPQASSTTVVLMKLRVVYNANIWRSLGASGAMWTTPGYAPHAAGWPARDARRGVESPRHSEAQESSRSLEGRQAARYGLGQHFFWCLLSGELGSPQPCQQRIGPHG